MVLVLLVLLVGAVPTALGSCNDTTQVEVSGLCCDKCPPGTFRAAWCDADTPTRCELCPHGTYRADFNIFPSCTYCTRCLEGLRQLEIGDCTPTQNRQCGCAKDESITRLGEGGTLFWCCPNCAVGTEALNECSYEDLVTPCSACSPGTFSEGRGAPCRNCTRCEREKYPCTNTSDTVCSDVSENGTVIAAGVVPVSLLIVAAVLMILRMCRAPFTTINVFPLPAQMDLQMPQCVHCQLLTVAALKILRRCRGVNAKKNLPPSRGASSYLDCSTRGSSPTQQHEKENNLENPLNPDKCDAQTITSSASSGIEVDMSEAVPFSQTPTRTEVS